MRYLTSIILSVLLVIPITGKSQDMQAQKIVSLTKAPKSHTWYVKQLNLWNKEIAKNPGNAEAWFNYYRASRYAWVTSYQKTDSTETLPDLNTIVADMEKAVPETFEYAYVRFISSTDRNDQVKYLLKSYELAPDNVELWLDLILYYEIRRNKQQTAAFCRKYFDADDMSPALYAWNYNMLIALDDSAVILTGGDNDTYPAWILQRVKGIRPDVTVINAGTLYYDDYRALIQKELGIPQFSGKVSDYSDFKAFMNAFIKHFIDNTKHSLYFAVTLPADYYSSLGENRYNEGLAIKYSPDPYDNIAPIKMNYEGYYLLDYIKISLMNDISQDVVNMLNTNYIKAFSLLYGQYIKANDTDRAEQLKDLMLTIANRSESERIIKQVNDLFGL